MLTNRGGWVSLIHFNLLVQSKVKRKMCTCSASFKYYCSVLFPQTANPTVLGQMLKSVFHLWWEYSMYQPIRNIQIIRSKLLVEQWVCLKSILIFLIRAKIVKCVHYFWVPGLWKQEHDFHWSRAPAGFFDSR